MIRLFGRLTLILCAFIILGCKKNQDSTIVEIDKAYLVENAIGKEVQLIDVRTAEEYEVEHIDDALNFDVLQGELFAEQIEALDKNEPVYLYCKMGGRSSRAAQLLKEKGFVKIYNYSGGYNNWVQD